MAADFWGNFARGQEAGLRRQEHGERMALLRIQREEAERTASRNRASEGAYGQLADLIDKYNGRTPTGPEQLGGPPEEPGLSRAPGQDAGGGAAPGMESTGPQDVKDRIGFGLYQNTSLFQNPKFMNDAAQIFLRAKMPEGVKWLEGAYKAGRENMIEAVKFAAAGDLTGFERAFNASGTTKVQPGSIAWADEQKTTIKGTDSDGKEFTLKPQEMLKAFLSPDAFLKHMQDEKKNSAEIAVKEADKKLKDAQAAYYTGAKTALANAQAGKASGGDGKLTPKQVNDLVGKAGLALRRQLESELSKEDAKLTVNGMVALLPDMQREVGAAIRNGTDPEVALGETYNKYKDRAAGISDAITAILQDSAKPWTKAEKDRRLSDGLTKLVDEFDITPAEIKRFLPATKVQKADADRVKNALATLGTAAARRGDIKRIPANVARPTTEEEFHALPKGSQYINPSDGQLYTKN